MKKYFLPSLLFVILIIALSGCGGGDANTPDTSNIVVHVTGLPYEYGTYKLVIQTFQNSDLVNNFSFESIPSDFEKEISVNKSISSIMVYLFAPYASEPNYFWSFKYSSDKSTYSTAYWLNYFYYFYLNKKVEFGISESLAQNVAVDQTFSLDFTNVPYYLYKLTGVLNDSIYLKAAASQGKVFLHYGDSLQSVAPFARDGASDTNWSQFITNYQYDTIYILLEPADNEQTTIASMDIKGAQITPIAGVITDMVPSSTPNRVFALCDTNDTLYYINPLTKSIDKTINLPPLEGPKMVYSARDHKLYFNNYSSGNITIFDILTETFSSFTVSSTEVCSDVRVAPINRRIYATTTSNYKSKLYIFDMDTLAKLSGPFDSPGSETAIDESRNKFFVTDTNYTYRYSVVNDNFVYEKQTDSFIPCHQFITPDGTKMISLGTIFDANTFTKIGDFHGYTYLYDFVITSPDGATLYCSSLHNSSDQYIYVIKAQDCSLIGKIAFPNSDYQPILTTNSDNSVLVGYSRNEYYGDSGTIYYYDDLTNLNSLSKALKLNSSSVKEMLLEIPAEKLKSVETKN